LLWSKVFGAWAWDWNWDGMAVSFGSSLGDCLKWRILKALEPLLSQEVVSSSAQIALRTAHGDRNRCMFGETG